MNVPTKRETVITRHEWTIGEESTHPTAKDFADGINLAEADMRTLGVNLTYDDCYHVRAGDGGEIVLYVDIKEPA